MRQNDEIVPVDNGTLPVDNYHVLPKDILIHFDDEALLSLSRTSKRWRHEAIQAIFKHDSLKALQIQLKFLKLWFHYPSFICSAPDKWLHTLSRQPQDKPERNEEEQTIILRNVCIFYLLKALLDKAVTEGDIKNIELYTQQIREYFPQKIIISIHKIVNLTVMHRVVSFLGNATIARSIQKRLTDIINLRTCDYFSDNYRIHNTFIRPFNAVVPYFNRDNLAILIRAFPGYSGKKIDDKLNYVGLKHEYAITQIVVLDNCYRHLLVDFNMLVINKILSLILEYFDHDSVYKHKFSHYADHVLRCWAQYAQYLHINNTLMVLDQQFNGIINLHKLQKLVRVNEQNQVSSAPIQVNEIFTKIFAYLQHNTFKSQSLIEHNFDYTWLKMRRTIYCIAAISVCAQYVASVNSHLTVTDIAKYINYLLLCLVSSLASIRIAATNALLILSNSNHIKLCLPEINVIFDTFIADESHRKQLIIYSAHGHDHCFMCQGSVVQYKFPLYAMFYFAEKLADDRGVILFKVIIDTMNIIQNDEVNHAYANFPLQCMINEISEIVPLFKAQRAIDYIKILWEQQKSKYFLSIYAPIILIIIFEHQPALAVNFMREFVTILKNIPSNTDLFSWFSVKQRNDADKEYYIKLNRAVAWIASQLEPGVCDELISLLREKINQLTDRKNDDSRQALLFLESSSKGIIYIDTQSEMREVKQEIDNYLNKNRLDGCSRWRNNAKKLCMTIKELIQSKEWTKKLTLMGGTVTKKTANSPSVISPEQSLYQQDNKGLNHILEIIRKAEEMKQKDPDHIYIKAIQEIKRIADINAQPKGNTLFTMEDNALQTFFKELSEKCGSFLDSFHNEKPSDMPMPKARTP